MIDLVYVIGSTETHRVKIGHSTNVPERLAGIQRMSPVPLAVLDQIEGGIELEDALHQRFRDFRTHGEWFDFKGADPVATIRSAIAEGLLAPQRGKTPHRTFRSPDEIWNAAQVKAGIEGRTMTDVLNEFLKGYISTPPREQPEPPARDDASGN